MKRNTKIPCVLVSGLLSNASLWKHQVDHLREVAESIHVFSPTQNTAEKMVQSILEAAPPQFALVGHSMGGWLCLEIMRKAPDRIIKLCLLNSTAEDDSQEKKIMRQNMILKAKEGNFQKVAHEIATRFVFNPLVKSDVEKMFLEVGKEAFIGQEEAMLNRKEIRSVLPNIACQTLVIHSAKDKNFSLKEHEEITSKIPYAKLAIIEDCGHMTPLEMPQALTTLLRLWLEFNL